uniref:Uncharacterized protein n=1 Tax=Anopheles atroparvus TaxID=41427 RepID=A0A182IMP0_ANOAO
MLEGWYCRTMNEEARQQSALDAIIGETDQSEAQENEHESTGPENESEEGGSANVNIDYKALFSEMKRKVKNLIQQTPAEMLVPSFSSNMLPTSMQCDIATQEEQLTKEEIERHLQSQTMPEVVLEGDLPTDMFNNISFNESIEQMVASSSNVMLIDPISDPCTPDTAHSGTPALVQSPTAILK